MSTLRSLQGARASFIISEGWAVRGAGVGVAPNSEDMKSAEANTGA
jgi:hypothetical protein